MDSGLISKRYAKALLEFSTERGEDKAVYERMRTLSASMAAVPHMRDALANPILSREDKSALILSASGGGKAGFSFSRFIPIVLKNNREKLMQFIALSYMELYRRAHRISVVSLVSVEPLSDRILDRIKFEVEKRTHGTVEFEIHIDESILGGIVFQIDDLRLNATVAGQLEKIRRQFIQKNRVII